MPSSASHPATPAGSPRGGRRRRLALGAAAAVALLGIAGWAGAFAWGNGEGGRAFLKARAEAALRGRFGSVEVGEAGLDPLLRARLGPVTIPGTRPGAPPLVRAASVVLRPRLLSLLAGRVELASVTLRSVHVAPGPGGEDLRRALERRSPGPARPGASPPAPLPAVHLHGLFVDLARAGGARLEEIGPIDLDVEVRRGPDGLAGTAHLGLPGGGHLELELRPGTDGTEVRAGGSVTLPSDVPDGLAHRLPVSLVSGTFRLEATGSYRDGGREATLSAEARTRDLSLAGPRVGPVPIGPIACGASGRVSWSGADRRLVLEEGRVTLGDTGEVGARLSGEAWLRGDPRFTLGAHVEAVPWQALVESLPPELGPPPSAPQLSGSLSARASLSGPLARRGEWDVQVDLDLEDLRRASRASGPTWLSSGFEWRPIDPGPGEPPRRIAVGPGNPAFVPYAEIPQTLVRAVTASEDAGFFGHRGFDFREIASAVAERGRVRGASTISQQLAKNLFLSPERTLARKVREALGTIALEASVSKARLLEIYLNIAEWGPGVYGVGEAARYWFGKDARLLTPRESAFLATVIPSPRRFAARLHRSGISPWWNARIDDVLGKMRIQNQLSEEQLAAALAEPLSPLASGQSPVPEEAGAPEAGEPEPNDDPPASGRAGDPAPPARHR